MSAMRLLERALARFGLVCIPVLAVLCWGGAPLVANTVPLPAHKPVAAVSGNSDLPLPSRKPVAKDTEKAHPASAPDSAVTPPYPRPKPFTGGKGRLSAADARLYKNIFFHQSRGEWDKADDYIRRLGDRRLYGHVLYQRYMHPTAYKSTFEELSNWLASYYDHPGADDIYKLALARKPAGFKGKIRKPRHTYGINGFLNILFDQNHAYQSPKKRTDDQKQEIERLRKEIREYISGGAPSKAYKKLLADRASSYLDRVEQDELKAQIARAYMHDGNIRKAYDLARTSAQRSGAKVPLAGWIAGLSAWRLGKYRDAAGYFEYTATSPYASSWTASAGAYWASRAHMRAGQVGEINPWLKRAAAYPRTFYGLIATRALGLDFDFNWEMPVLTAGHIKVLSKLPAGSRAIALVDAGQYHQAERELRRINPGQSERLLEALLAYAHKNDLPSFAMRLAEAVAGPGGSLYDAALYPLSPWQPQEGYRVDRALIHALIRQESRFNPYAESRSGATGLMQLMPATASYVSGEEHFRERKGRHSLKDPETNLDIGQRYVETLLGQDLISAELFSLVIAYNAGPGNLAKWKRSLADIQDDPLLFVESIPIAETRVFVERVMANYWIYRLRLGQPTPSLDAVAEGNWARYVGLDDVKRADNAGKEILQLADGRF